MDTPVTQLVNMLADASKRCVRLENELSQEQDSKKTKEAEYQDALNKQQHQLEQFQLRLEQQQMELKQLQRQLLSQEQQLNQYRTSMQQQEAALQRLASRDAVRRQQMELTYNNVRQLSLQQVELSRCQMEGQRMQQSLKIQCDSIMDQHRQLVKKAEEAAAAAVAAAAAAERDSSRQDTIKEEAGEMEEMEEIDHEEEGEQDYNELVRKALISNPIVLVKRIDGAVVKVEVRDGEEGNI